jgi:hypothetical protein
MLKLLSQHIEPVVNHQELLDILMTVVKGILTREQSSHISVKYLIRVVEQASRILLDNAAAPTEPEEK